MVPLGEVGSVLLRVFHELRKSDKNFRFKSPLMKFILERAREHQVTEGKYSKSYMEMLHICKTYQFYLSNTRELRNLRSIYKTKERTIESAANLVGLALPKTS
ncbi:hypothetical protein AB6A40_000615 [Gnathostoma spinigerum]|uniref:Protein FMC1 homolog n=1 Tax=Gnathostoma spinigerum TaxID=75299 RepID=A0ABD6E4H7_9BILA